MRKSIYFSICLLFCALITWGQEGLPYISYYNSNPEFENRNWTVCQDTAQNIYFANKKGVTEFDGTRWQTHHLPFIPLDIARSPHRGDLFVLSEGNYGKLHRDDYGRLIYDSLTVDGELDRTLKKILFSGSSVIFYGKQQISFLDPDSYALQLRLSAGPGNRYAGMVVAGERIWVNLAGRGLMEIVGDSLRSDRTIRTTSGRNIQFTLPFSEQEVLVGFENGELVLFNGGSFRSYEISNKYYFHDYGLGDAAIVNDSLMAISSLYGGVLIINRTDGKVRFALNYEGGLPEDEVFSVHTGEDGGLWISYLNGACRVDPTLPIGEYTNFPGLEGLLINSVWYNGVFYVATSEGLFFLDEVKNYKEVEVLLKQLVTEADHGEMDSGDDEGNQGFFRNILDRVRQSPKETVERTTRTTTRFIRKKESKLQSVKHVFKKVKGLNSSCKELFPTSTTLLAGSPSGLYGVNDSIAIRISDSRYINDIHAYDSSSFLVVSNDGFEILQVGESGWSREKKQEFLNIPLFGVSRFKDEIWLSGYNRVFRIPAPGGELENPKSYLFDSYYPEEYHVNLFRDTVFLFTTSNVRYFEPEADSFFIYEPPWLLPGAYHSINYFESPNAFRWLYLDNKVVFLDHHVPGTAQMEKHLGLFKKITSLTYNPGNGNYWLIDDQNRLFSVAPEIADHHYGKFSIHFDKILDNTGEQADMDDLSFMPEDLPLKIYLSAPFFPGNEQTQFQYNIDKRMDKWSAWSESPQFSLFLESGDYSILVRARNFLGEVTATKKITLTVVTPFYQKPWFFLSLSPVILVLLYVFFMLRERKIKHDKAILEERVEQRTVEIQDQKKQIEIQRDEIKDSITYASRIQSAILPSQKLFEKSFSDYFILFRPRDIVSGDFYWITEKNGSVIFTAADCTGHGVPGAFMSMLGNSFLNEITKEKKEQSASSILEQLRQMITTALSQSGNNSRPYDGMDIALCIYDKKSGEIEFSGAHNPLYHVRNGDLTVYKANRMPIGYYPKEQKFTSQRIKVSEGDIIYLFSDGFPDQFGGDKNKKYTKKRFKKTLVSLSDLPLLQQQSRLEEVFTEWKGENSQIDDVLVMGIRI